MEAAKRFGALGRLRWDKVGRSTGLGTGRLGRRMGQGCEMALRFGRSDVGKRRLSINLNQYFFIDSRCPPPEFPLHFAARLHAPPKSATLAHTELTSTNQQQARSHHHSVPSRLINTPWPHLENLLGSYGRNTVSFFPLFLFGDDFFFWCSCNPVAFVFVLFCWIK